MSVCLLFCSPSSYCDLLLFYFIPADAQGPAFAFLLKFFKEGKKITVYLHNYQEGLPGDYLLEPVSLITNVMSYYNS